MAEVAAPAVKTATNSVINSIIDRIVLVHDVLSRVTVSGVLAGNLCQKAKSIQSKLEQCRDAISENEWILDQRVGKSLQQDYDDIRETLSKLSTSVKKIKTKERKRLQERLSIVEKNVDHIKGVLYKRLKATDTNVTSSYKNQRGITHPLPIDDSLRVEPLGAEALIAWTDSRIIPSSPKEY